MEKLVKKHIEKVKFIIVGGLNTGIDFVILFALTFLGLDKIVANFFSTSTAFIFSFFANKKFTFKTETNKRHFIYFLTITMIGLWIIQPIIIGFTEISLNDFNLNKNIILLIGKIIATGFTMVWNYILYKKFVFNTHL